MAKEKEGKSGGSKVKKILLWTFAVIGVLLIIFIAWALISTSKKDIGINEIQVLNQDYTNAFNSFNSEYQISSPNQVTSLSNLPRAREGVKNAFVYLGSMKGNITLMLNAVKELKPGYSGAQLDWANSAEICYNKELSRIALYEEILNNEKAYFDYYEPNKNYDKTYEEYLQILSSYAYNAEANNKQATIDDLNKIREKVLLLKQYAEASYVAIPFNYYQKTTNWATKYLEGIDLELRYWASPSTDLAKQMNDKYNDASQSLVGVTSSSVTEEFDKWYSEKVTSKQDEVDRITSSSSDCDNAGDLFATAFPGNANVVKDIEAED